MQAPPHISRPWDQHWGGGTFYWLLHPTRDSLPARSTVLDNSPANHHPVGDDHWGRLTAYLPGQAGPVSPSGHADKPIQSVSGCRTLLVILGSGFIKCTRLGFLISKLTTLFVRHRSGHSSKWRTQWGNAVGRPQLFLWEKGAFIFPPPRYFVGFLQDHNSNFVVIKLDIG